MFDALINRCKARRREAIYPENILIIARGGYGGHYIEGEIRKNLPNAQITVVKREYLHPDQVSAAQVIIVSGYGDSFSTKKIMVCKKENVDLPEIAILRNCRLCDHSGFINLVGMCAV